MLSVTFAAEDSEMLTQIAGRQTWDFPADVFNMCSDTLDRLGFDDDPETIALALRAGAKIYGRLGEMASIRDLIATFGDVVGVDVQYDLFRYLLNAAAVRGDSLVAEEAFDRAVAIGELTGTVFGAYLRALWVASADPHQIMAAMRSVSADHDVVPYPVGLETVIDDPADKRLILAIAGAICPPLEVIEFRKAVQSEDIDAAMQILQSAQDGFSSVQMTVSGLLRLLGKDQRTDEIVEAIAHFDRLGIAIGPTAVTNLFRTVTTSRNGRILSLAEERSSLITMDSHVVGSAITAYAAMDQPERVIEVLDLGVEMGLIDADIFGKAVQACLRYRLTPTAVMLIERDPIGAAADQVPVLLQRAVQGLLRGNAPDDAIGLIRTCRERSVSIPAQAWSELIVGLAAFNHSATAAVLFDAARSGVILGSAVLNSAVRVVATDPNVAPSTLFDFIRVLSRFGYDVTTVSYPSALNSLPELEALEVRRAFDSLTRGTPPALVGSLLKADLLIAADRDRERIDQAIKEALALRLEVEPLVQVLGDQVREVDMPEASLEDQILIRSMLMRRLRHVGALDQLRQVFDQCVYLIDEYRTDADAPKLSHALLVGLWDVILRAYVGHDAGPRQALRLVTAALDRDIDLDVAVVKVAIRACGRNLNFAGTLFRKIEQYKRGKGDEVAKDWHSKVHLLDMQMALIAALDQHSNELSQTRQARALWYLAGTETRGNNARTVGGIPLDERRQYGTDWWAHYLLVLALTTPKEFAETWEQFSGLSVVDRKNGQPPRTHNPQIWSARVIYTAMYGPMDPDTDLGSGVSASVSAIQILHAHVLIDSHFEPLEWMFEALLEAEWGETSERAIKRFRIGVATDLSGVVAWTQARVAMACEQGRPDVTQDVLAHLARVASGLDEQSLWVSHARASAESGTPEAYADIDLILHRMTDAGLTPTAATLVRLIDAGRLAGAQNLLTEIAVLMNDPVQGAHLTNNARSDLTERLVTGFVEVGLNSEAIALANEVILSGRALSLAAKSAVRRAQLATGGNPDDDVADPRETMKVLALFAADIVHDVGTPGELISNYCRAARKSLEAGELGKTTERLDDIAESTTMLFERLSPLRQFAGLLQAESADGTLDVTVGLRNHFAGFADQGRTVADLKGTKLKVHFERSVARNNAYVVRAPALFIDIAVKNLVRNAGQALANAGTPDPRITILVRDTNEPTVGFPAGFVSLSVIDNGPGLQASVREAVLSGRTTSRGPEGSAAGVGMGLLLVHTIATILEAGFQIPEQARGTTIELRLHPNQKGDQ